MNFQLDDIFPDPEQAWLDELAAAELTWQKYEGWTLPDGSILVRCETNDNRDLGCPSEWAQWELTCKSRMDFDRICGVSRTGCFGTKVDVYLDGQKLF